MGATIARLFAGHGHEVTAWNRSAGKADALAPLGVRAAASAAQAIAASDAVVLIVADYRAADAILHGPGIAQAARGKLFINLGTGSPGDARAAEAWAGRHGARHLDGAIQAAPSQMGQPDTPILLSGAKPAWDQAQPLLAALGGGNLYLGEDVAAAATMDLATLSYVYGAFLGFIHGARMAETQGLDVAQYGRIVHRISPSFGAFFEHEAKVIAAGDFGITESPLRISIEATARILRESQAAGLDARVPALSAALFAEADRAGLGGEEAAALIKLLR
jgi:3-hydroxyisobutyrate dehydrogenase-like beta-hydroxyacid dehydrogenase